MEVQLQVIEQLRILFIQSNILVQRLVGYIQRVLIITIQFINLVNQISLFLQTLRLVVGLFKISFLFLIVAILKRSRRLECTYKYTRFFRRKDPFYILQRSLLARLGRLSLSIPKPFSRLQDLPSSSALAVEVYFSGVGCFKAASLAQ